MMGAQPIGYSGDPKHQQASFGVTAIPGAILGQMIIVWRLWSTVCIATFIMTLCVHSPPLNKSWERLFWAKSVYPSVRNVWRTKRLPALLVHAQRRCRYASRRAAGAAYKRLVPRQCSLGRKRTTCFSSIKRQYWSRVLWRNIFLGGPEQQRTREFGKARLVWTKHETVWYVEALYSIASSAIHHRCLACFRFTMKQTAAAPASVCIMESLRGKWGREMRCLIKNFSAIKASFGTE